MEYGISDDIENGESEDDEFGRSAIPDEDVLGTGGWGTIESQAFRCVDPDEDVLGTGGWGTIESQAFRCVDNLFQECPCPDDKLCLSHILFSTGRATVLLSSPISCLCPCVRLWMSL